MARLTAKAGSKSEGERLRRQSVREEMAEVLEGAGIATGGFAGAGSIRERMSPSLQRQIASQEEAEAREEAEAKRERERQVAAFADSANRHAIAQALEAGEAFHPRMLRGEGLGHTREEFVRMVSDRQDVEDLRFEAAELQEFRRWKAQKAADTSGDMSAPTARQREADELMRERARRYQEKEWERRFTGRAIRLGYY